MVDLILPAVVMTLPVLVVVALAVAFRRTLDGSCGGAAPGEACPRCGRPAVEVPLLGRGRCEGARP